MYVQRVGIPTTDIHDERPDMSTAIVHEYEAHLDTKNRITIRGAESEYYAVKAFSDGRVLLEPRVLVPPEFVSKRALKMMDRSATNFAKGKVSKPKNLD